MITNNRLLTDLVIWQGNAIYAEIPGNLAEQKATNIEEGGIYDISRFRVCAAKNCFQNSGWGQNDPIHISYHSKTCHKPSNNISIICLSANII